VDRDLVHEADLVTRDAQRNTNDLTVPGAIAT
jgi:hypothetical protein